jgi:hypothetical protein
MLVKHKPTSLRCTSDATSIKMVMEELSMLETLDMSSTMADHFRRGGSFLRFRISDAMRS